MIYDVDGKPDTIIVEPDTVQVIGTPVFAKFEPQFAISAEIEGIVGPLVVGRVI